MKYAKKAGYVFALALFLILTAGPFLWTFLLSVTPDHAIFSQGSGFWPGELIWDNYIELFSGGQRGSRFFASLLNSLKATGVTLCIGIPAALLSAYALGRMEFKGRMLIRDLLLVTMVIPVMATIIPLYRMFAQGEMLDNLFWLSLVYVSSYLPMAVWLMTNYFATIPREMEEAAFIDGCGRVGSFFRLIGFLHGDKAYGHRYLGVCDKGQRPVRAGGGGRHAGPGASCPGGVYLPEVSGDRHDKRIGKRIAILYPVGTVLFAALSG